MYSGKVSIEERIRDDSRCLQAVWWSVRPCRCGGIEAMCYLASVGDIREGVWLRFGAMSTQGRGATVALLLLLVSLPVSWLAESRSGEDSDFSPVCSRFSNPSTRFSNASSTSVLGPRFLGTASARDCQFLWRSHPHNSQRGISTIDTGAGKNLAGFTSGS